MRLAKTLIRSLPIEPLKVRRCSTPADRALEVRCTAGTGGLAEAFRQVWLDTPPGQDPAGAVSAATTAGGPGRPAEGAAGDVYLSGLHPPVGAVAEGEQRGQAADGGEPLAAGDWEDRRLV